MICPCPLNVPENVFIVPLPLLKPIGVQSSPFISISAPNLTV